MTAEWPPDRQPEVNAAAFLILLLLMVLAGSGRRRRATGRIRLGAPSFVTLAPDSADRVASELGAALGDLLDLERQKTDG